MKLLIVTQKVDSTDPILGFFHAWIAEFSMHCERVTVLTQEVGSHNFSDTVHIVSLGKERGASRLSQIVSFWQAAFKQRKHYDKALVHMTPIWVVLGAPLWLLLRKRMYLWYEIKRGSWKLSIALRLVHKVFAATEHGLPTVSKKQVTVGHGIDCDVFAPDHSRREANHLVAVGRLTAVKQYDVIVRALSKLPDCRLTIAGGTITEEDKKTEIALQGLMQELGVTDRVSIGWVPPQEMPELLQQADCMLHASQGGLDKAVLQAMACECPVVTTSEAAQSVLPDACHATADTLAEKAQAILALSDKERQSLSSSLRSVVEQDHSLTHCIERLVSEM